MKTQQEDTSKREYNFPLIECIKLDNEISLQLASSPPIFPGEDLVQNHSDNNPFIVNA